MALRRGIAVFALSLAAPSCNAEREPERIDRARQAIVGGAPSDEREDATVMLVWYDAASGRKEICTATLVAPRLVLTARHCVATANTSVACAADGTPLFGGEITGDHRPSDLFVFVGKDRPDLDPTRFSPDGRGLSVVHDGSRMLCDHDLALVVLEEPIVGIAPASLRLDRDVRVGEKVVAVGWGVSSDAAEPEVRQQRAGVTVRRVGPDESQPVLTASELLFDESICLGDSGGPLFSEETGAVVGVVSRGGNGADPSRGGPAATCLDADNVGTKLSAFREVVLDAFERAGAVPELEAAPDEGCAVAASSRARPSPSAAVVALAAFAALRRRRPR